MGNTIRNLVLKQRATEVKDKGTANGVNGTSALGKVVVCPCLLDKLADIQTRTELHSFKLALEEIRIEDEIGTNCLVLFQETL